MKTKTQNDCEFRLARDAQVRKAWDEAQKPPTLLQRIVFLTLIGGVLALIAWALLANMLA